MRNRYANVMRFREDNTAAKFGRYPSFWQLDHPAFLPRSTPSVMQSSIHRSARDAQENRQPPELQLAEVVLMFVWTRDQTKRSPHSRCFLCDWARVFYTNGIPESKLQDSESAPAVAKGIWSPDDQNRVRFPPEGPTFECNRSFFPVEPL